MASITDIKRRILELSPAPFQEFCDTLISKHGYESPDEMDPESVL